MRRYYIASVPATRHDADFEPCIICGDDTRHYDETGTVRLCKAPECRRFVIMSKEEHDRVDMALMAMVMDASTD